MAVRSDTRIRMIEGATSLMRTHGFAATSFKDVWELTDTPRGSVYFHFPGGKEELGREVIRNACDTLLTWTAEAQAEADSAAAFLHRLAAKVADFLEGSGYEQGCPIAAIAIEAPPESALRKAASAAFQSWGDRIATVLVTYGVPQDRSVEIARSTVASLEGAILVSKADQNREAITRAASLLAQAMR